MALHCLCEGQSCQNWAWVLTTTGGCPGTGVDVLNAFSQCARLCGGSSASPSVSQVMLPTLGMQGGIPWTTGGELHVYTVKVPSRWREHSCRPQGHPLPAQPFTLVASGDVGTAATALTTAVASASRRLLAPVKPGLGAVPRESMSNTIVCHVAVAPHTDCPGPRRLQPRREGRKFGLARARSLRSRTFARAPHAQESPGVEVHVLPLSTSESTLCAHAESEGRDPGAGAFEVVVFGIALQNTAGFLYNTTFA
jgi:hypothetical protein